ncbi:TIR domain-containing protein [Bradyrhizobium sp. Arg62]|nr:TIR domain-containing protein [Bradyrhizobium brasilense]MCC8951159.1 TIR domain-containing protein [Bradyrhizobium brasilense]
MWKRSKCSRFFHVSLSFAGEQREYVRRVSKALQRTHKLKVFFDEEQQSRLAATHVNSTLDEIFRFHSKWVVVFCSKEYVQKKWPSFEGRSIVAAALEEPDNYLILATFDDAHLPGWPDTYHRFDLSKMKASAFAKAIADVIAQRTLVDRNLIFFKMATRQYR